MDSRRAHRPGPGSSPFGQVVPTILGAKPASAQNEAASQLVKILRDEGERGGGKVPLKLASGSLKLITDQWEHTGERLTQLLSDNRDFMVIGALGVPSSGKSTLLNELYGFSTSESATSAGVLPPFPVQSDESRMLAKHTTTGIEMRVAPDNFILLDSQPLFSASLLMDLTRPDGSSSLSPMTTPGDPPTPTPPRRAVPGGRGRGPGAEAGGAESLPAEIAVEIMGLQSAVFLFSVCHVVLLVADSLADTSLWKFMQTVEMLKQGIPDPSMPPTTPVSPQRATSAAPSATSAATPAAAALPHRAGSPVPQSAAREGRFAQAVFVHNKLSEVELSSVPSAAARLASLFPDALFNSEEAVLYQPLQERWQALPEGHTLASQEEVLGSNQEGAGEGSAESSSRGANGTLQASPGGGRGSKAEGIGTLKTGHSRKHGGCAPSLFVLPMRGADKTESFEFMLRQLRDQVLSLPRRPFARPVTEHEWLQGTSRVWDAVRRSPQIAEYCKVLQASGQYK